MMDDEQLLHAYVRERSESAFGELVGRHIDFVYSTALRVVNGDSHQAQDVTQTVFIDLARKAGSLPDDVALPGWLHCHTCYTAATAVRTERRRQRREQTAMEMNALDDNIKPAWEQVAPYLDESLNQLNPADRDALVLRFLKQQDLRAVGTALGISDDAAQKRVDRALQKLHVLLKHRGATLSAAALGTALATEAVTAAPAGLAGSVAGAALAAAGGGTATGLKLLLYKLSGLSRAQASFLCLAIAAGPVTWEWNVKRACLARAALAQSQLEVVREEAAQSAADLAQLRAEFARLDTAVAEAEKDSARYAEAARKLELLKGQVRSLLAGTASPWSTNQPYVRFPKAAVNSLDPQHRPMAGFSELALEIYGITAAEKPPVERALARYFQGVYDLMGATAYETNLPSTQPRRLTKTVVVPPLGQPLQALAEQTGLQLTDVLGGEREKLLFDGWDKGSIQFFRPGIPWNIVKEPQTMTVWVEPSGTSGGAPRYGWSRSSSFGGTSGEGRLSVIPEPILERFFYPWMDQLGVTNRVTW